MTQLIKKCSNLYFFWPSMHHQKNWSIKRAMSWQSFENCNLVCTCCRWSTRQHRTQDRVPVFMQIFFELMRQIHTFIVSQLSFTITNVWDYLFMKRKGSFGSQTWKFQPVAFRFVVVGTAHDSSGRVQRKTTFLLARKGRGQAGCPLQGLTLAIWRFPTRSHFLRFCHIPHWSPCWGPNLYHLYLWGTSRSKL